MHRPGPQQQAQRLPRLRGRGHCSILSSGKNRQQNRIIRISGGWNGIWTGALPDFSREGGVNILKRKLFFARETRLIPPLPEVNIKLFKLYKL